MTTAPVDLDVRLHRAWALEAAVWITRQISRVHPIGNGLIDFSLRFTRADYRESGDTEWQRGSRLYMAAEDECDCDCAVCTCGEW